MKLTMGWVLAAAVALYIVEGTKIGPVIFTVNERYAMGIHSGDFLALIPLVTVVVLTLVARSRQA